ncbi:MAG: HEPN domain-containing protein [bacterium]
MENNLRDLSGFRLTRAKEDFEASKELFENGYFGQSLSRSYYSIFQATRSLLALERFDSKKHSGVISYFIHNFIKTGKIEKEFGTILTLAEKNRIQSDYHDFYIASKEDAETQIENAEKFINMIQNYIQKITEK